ncbi:50S ribosomal protein L15 [Pseudostreptobacillus hongkongensis]|uniref:50S ribosomal protein L15 n=1 Tax=Pseudostreptobacillus hongkongensis TaxID=1162717 RepID=UPI0008367F2C|nr:50S ribosomal protein L15 [Pseudostreptobacillus hongkongensis]
MNLNELRPAEGSKRSRRRIGRGHGSGWGKTAGKGHNGQKQRSGTYVSAAFEGGQMPLIRRVPKRGFSNSEFKKDMLVINLKDIVDKFNANEEVTLETLIQAGVVKNAKFITTSEGERIYTSLLKIVGNYELEKALKVKAHKVSKGAKEAVEKFGGSVELVEIKSFANVAGNAKEVEGE